jgi:hypothetical protein
MNTSKAQLGTRCYVHLMKMVVAACPVSLINLKQGLYLAQMESVLGLLAKILQRRAMRLIRVLSRDKGLVAVEGGLHDSTPKCGDNRQA